MRSDPARGVPTPHGLMTLLVSLTSPMRNRQWKRVRMFHNQYGRLQMLFWYTLLGVGIFFIHSHLAQYTSQHSLQPFFSETNQQPFSIQASSYTSLPESERYHYRETFASNSNRQLVENANWNLNQHELSLALRDQIPQQASVIAGSTANDEVYVVWCDLRRGCR